MDATARIKNLAIALQHLCSITSIKPGCIFDVSRLLSEEISSMHKENEQRVADKRVAQRNLLDDDIPF